MNYCPAKKKAFLKISGSKSQPEKMHLFCILNDVVDHKHFIVPISSIIPGKKYDDTCLLFPADHPFIKHASFVAYNFIDECHTTTIIKCMNASEYQEKDDFKDGVFIRICRGVALSKRTPTKFKIAHRYCTADK